MGCACRGDSGHVHVACLVEAAVAQKAHRGFAVWRVCQTCKQSFTGALQMSLATVWKARTSHLPIGDMERPAAEWHFACAQMDAGDHVGAEPTLRMLHQLFACVCGHEDPVTLCCAGDLSNSLAGQMKYEDAIRIEREIHATFERTLGPEHRDTLAAANNLCSYLTKDEKYDESESIMRRVLSVHTRPRPHARSQHARSGARTRTHTHMLVAARGQYVRCIQHPLHFSVDRIALSAHDGSFVTQHIT